MTCSSCSIAIRKALRRLNGIREANVSTTEKRARVVYDPRLVTPVRMIRAIEELGYGARIEE
jgi:copper chaperone CopZ